MLPSQVLHRRRAVSVEFELLSLSGGTIAPSPVRGIAMPDYYTAAELDERAREAQRRHSLLDSIW